MLVSSNLAPVTPIRCEFGAGRERWSGTRCRHFWHPGTIEPEVAHDQKISGLGDSAAGRAGNGWVVELWHQPLKRGVRSNSGTGEDAQVVGTEVAGNPLPARSGPRTTMMSRPATFATGMAAVSGWTAVTGTPSSEATSAAAGCRDGTK